MFLKSLKPRNNWEILSYKINNKVWSKELFQSIYSKFTSSIYSKFTEQNHMFILFKIKYNTNEIITIGNLQRINKNDLEWYSNWIISNMIIKSEDYKDEGIFEIIFSFGFKEEIIHDKDKIKLDLKFQTIKNLNLPISFNPVEYGLLINKSINAEFTEYTIHNKDITFIIKQFDGYNEVNLFREGILLINWIDKFIELNSFERNINDQLFIFKNNILIFSSKKLKSKFIPKIKKSEVLNNNFITLDIETYVNEENLLVPYCICFYDGKITKSFYLTEYKSIDNMMIDLFTNLFRRKYNFQNIYVHNLANFDIIFLLKYLVKWGKIKPIIRNNKFISIQLETENGYIFTFKDSLQIILGSLRDLGKSFGLKLQKGTLDHDVINKNNLLRYRNKVIEYCKIDCILLHQIINKFAQLIFQLFSISIHKYPTLASLAFAIFRSNFMKEVNIPKLPRKHVEEIRSSYTGGAVDMYIPTNNKKELVYWYDVNSLYPASMLKQLMPIGIVNQFVGNIFDINPQAFGFFKCVITSPDKIENPILQTHVLTEGGMRTISPLGTWVDYIFSPELLNAQKYGYTFEILEGYTFEQDNIFSDYVTFLFDLRSKFPKSDPMNFIGKILLNSLYGRFGMDDNYPLIDIIPNEYFQDFENKFLDNIKETVELGNYKLIIHSYPNLSDNTGNVSIGIAAAITSYSRIHMSQFKNNPDFILFYTDTDSVFTNKPLPEYMVGTEIGKMKLENICQEAIWLGPKVYCLLTEDNKFIYKVKGLKSNVELTMKDFKKLLNKNSFLEKSQIKWQKRLTEAHIALINEAYTLRVNDNKRKLIYNKKGKLIRTYAYIINKDKIIINKD